MSVDLYKIQQKAEQPRKRKKVKKAPGFAAQKQALEASKYYVRTSQKKSR
ncbi:MAG: hypothetical protein WCT16_01250 [Candidatus Buchananbacteria bacterium]